MTEKKKCHVKDCELPVALHGVFCEFHQSRRATFGERSSFTHVNKKGDIRNIKLERRFERRGPK